MTHTEWAAIAAISVIAVGYAIVSELYARKVNRHVAEEPDRDPYIAHVRSMRATPGAQKDVAVSIQDAETGEFYYYPRGSETRMRRDPVSKRLYIDM
jgi:hypothetical protein